MQKFRWTIEKRDESLYIESFTTRSSGNGERKNWIYLSIKSIPLLCSKLTEYVVFNRKTIIPIKNVVDYITFSFSASRERPSLGLTGDHKKDGDLIDGVLDIPIHPLGDKKLNMTYINPFLEDLKKYLD